MHGGHGEERSQQYEHTDDRDDRAPGVPDEGTESHADQGVQRGEQRGGGDVRRAPGALRERPWWSRRIARARPDEGYGALRAGASGFLAALRVVAAGEALIAPSVTRRLIEEFAARPEPAAAPRRGVVEGIADRER